MHSSKPALLVILVVLFAISACAQQEKLESVSGVSGGFSKIEGRLEEASPSFNRFPKNQIPHTLLKKPVADGKLANGFGYRLNRNGVKVPRRHKGLDFVAPVGTPVLAAGDGVIVKLYVSNSYGNYIRIQHANGFITVYAHMNEFAQGLAEGVRVVKGQIIGTVGTTGRSSGPHLHYELIYNGKHVNPLY